LEDRQDTTANATQTTEEKVQFIADARLISVLGEQLIGSEKVGILELVKNAYDANATECTVTLENVPGISLDSESAEVKEYSLQGPIITITDDGSGMSHEDLVSGWLRPATSRRAAVKERLRVERAAADERGSRKAFDALVDELKNAHGGRLPVGEKGIGRLATHRLGRHLWLRTKTADDPREWELKIDWQKFDAFSGAPVDLDKIDLILRHQPPTADYGSRGSGTTICSYGGRAGYRWTKEQIVDVGRAVNALRSPRNAPQGFEPKFSSPHVASIELASPLDRVAAPFDFIAIVDESGIADIEILFEPPAGLDQSVKPFKEEERRDLRSANKDLWAKNGKALRQPECGPFLLHLRAWLRLRDWLGPDYDQVTQYLDRFGGITIFRDGLATLPAEQGAKVDWLGLQISQIKKASNISYYHLAGEIELQQQLTLSLRDRSSREGMIQTQAYQDLAQLTRAAVDQLQFAIKGARDRWTKSKTRRIPTRTLTAYTKTAAKVAKRIAEDYDFKKDSLGIRDIVGGDEPVQRIAEAGEALQSLVKHIEFLEDERDGLMEAAGFGLAIGIAVHEMGRLASAIVSDIQSLSRSPSQDLRTTRTISSLQHRADSLLSEIRRLAPLRVTRGDSARSMSLRSAVEAARSAFTGTLSSSKIEVKLGKEDFRIRGRYGALVQVFANLFDNAIYWIGAQSDGGGGGVNVRIFPDNRTVSVSDSGPGISKKMMDHLFEPFYSEKSPPSGLGLYICKYYLEQCGASIRVAGTTERNESRGAQFLLDFSKSQAGEP
jgi:signal transduction histidine kinase